MDYLDGSFASAPFYDSYTLDSSNRFYPNYGDDFYTYDMHNASMKIPEETKTIMLKWPAALSRGIAHQYKTNVVVFPESIETLIIGCNLDHYDRSEYSLISFEKRQKYSALLSEIHTLRHIRFIRMCVPFYMMSLKTVTFPENLEVLKIDNIHQGIENINFPPRLKEFYIDGKYKHGLENVVLPETLEKISFDSICYPDIFKYKNTRFPRNLKGLCFSGNFYVTDFSHVVESCPNLSKICLIFGVVACRPHFFDEFGSYASDDVSDGASEDVSEDTGDDASEDASEDSSSVDATETCERDSIKRGKFINFSRDIKKVRFSSLRNLKSLYISGYDLPLKYLDLPENLETLYLNEFNESVDDFVSPRSLKNINFGYRFNKDISKMSLSPNTINIAFGGRFNFPLHSFKFPINLLSLDLGNVDCCSMDVDIINWDLVCPHLKIFSFGCGDYEVGDENVSNNIKLKRIRFSNSIVRLNIHDINSDIGDITFPRELRILNLGYPFSKSLDNVIFPEFFETLILPYIFNSSMIPPRHTRTYSIKYGDELL